MTGFSGQERRADIEKVVIDTLHKYIEIINTLENESPDIQRIYDVAPENMTRGRSYLQLAMDDTMNAFAYLCKDMEDKDRISMSCYLTLCRAAYGEDYSKADAADNLQARMLQMKAPDAKPDAMPQYIELIHSKAPKEVRQLLIGNWDAAISHITRHLYDEQSLAANINLDNISDAFNARVTDLKQEQQKAQEKQDQLKEDAVSVSEQASSSKDLVPLNQPQAIKAIRKQMKNLRAQLKELGAFGSNDLETLEDRLSEKDLPADIRKKVEEELDTANDTNEAAPEFQKIKNYLKWVADLPWEQYSDLEKTLMESEETLNAEHYGMDDAKEAIIEHFAVEKRTGHSNGKTLLLVGPPGVGKTSFGESIAKATGREYVRISLGGVNNESKIRGHGRTYMDSRPGCIADALKKAQTNNPVILLDEMDTLRDGGHNGDPVAALLEVLDPEQNKTFKDHYLGFDLDLSNILFIATANNLGLIPPALRDRMEIIHMDGYSQDEKIEIATRYLLPKQLAKAGLTDNDLTMPDELIADIISGYTREMGVRNLERKLGKICRKRATDIERGFEVEANLTAEDMEEYLGPAPVREKTVTEWDDQIGVVNGLYASNIGGGVLRVEVNKEPGGGMKLSMTGRLEQTISESVKVARTAVIENSKKLNLHIDVIGKYSLNVHILEGATPKDGPSAGIALATAMISELTDIPVRNDLAMTGEISQKGDVLPIGGLPQKLEGALRAGVTKVLIPADNEKDLHEVPEKILEALEIVPVSRIEEVIEHALTQPIPELKQEAETEAKTEKTPAAPPAPEKPEEKSKGKGKAKGGNNDNDKDAAPYNPPVLFTRRAPGLNM